MFNFKQGTALAVQQDLYIEMYRSGKNITKEQIVEMEQDLWVTVAEKLAPNNLVIRQYALIDLFNGTPKHGNKIFNLMNTLTYKTSEEYKLFAEGYSYFNYTMNILAYWIKAFRRTDVLYKIVDLVHKIEQGFIVTAYKKSGYLFPAPLGDLRDEPLDPHLQISNHKIKDKISIANLTFVNDYTIGLSWYVVRAKPIGLNTHIPKKTYVTTVTNGIFDNFEFYKGYDKKYKNVWDEIGDTLHYERLLSLL